MIIVVGDPVNVPRRQVAIAGSSAQLNCSYPGGLITWRRNGSEVEDGRISPVTIADEGEYVCDIYVWDYAVSTRVTVMLYVVGKSLPLLCMVVKHCTACVLWLWNGVFVADSSEALFTLLV